MVRGLVSLSTLILAAVGSAAPLAPGVGTEANFEVRTADDKTETVPDIFFYNWVDEAKSEESKREETEPDAVFVNWVDKIKRGDHQEEQN
ncbi:hypothetical protein F5X96DRAFT_680747 [Biscogniauxia mediterranea]|nr:hypothetical protein F5X96DRAFT_680747 [Biscogniauxia mediterranea]